MAIFVKSSYMGGCHGNGRLTCFPQRFAAVDPAENMEENPWKVKPS